MVFKKNWLSYLVWIGFMAFACIYHIVLGILLLSQIPLTDTYAQLGIIGLSVIVAAGFFSLLYRIGRSRIQNKKDTGTGSGLLWEMFFNAVFLLLGIFFRVSMIKSGQETIYYELASVTGQPVASVAHGAVYWYLCLLRGLFLLTGNSFLAGIVLQIVLQVLGAVVWYAFVRRLAGVKAAVLFMAGVMLFPQSIQKGVTYSPEVLYFLLFGVVLLMECRMLKRQSTAERIPWYGWLHLVFIGIGIGILTYLDISGVTLLIPVLFLFTVKQEAEEKGRLKKAVRSVMQLLTVWMVFLLTLCLLFFTDSVLSGTAPESVFAVWQCLFAYKGMDAVWNLLNPKTTEEIYVQPVASFLLILGIPAFFSDKVYERQMLLFTLYAGLVCAAGFGAGDGMTAEYLCLGAILTLAGACVQAVAPLSVEAGQKAEAGEETENGKEPVEETPGEGALSGQPAEAEPSGTKQESRHVNYIENPLPLPKKHEKKVLDYPYFVSTDRLKYDIKVSDEDDFDY